MLNANTLQRNTGVNVNATDTTEVVELVYPKTVFHVISELCINIR